eukprot:51935-Chlamydomonas_euryale.AAC.1
MVERAKGGKNVVGTCCRHKKGVRTTFPHLFYHRQSCSSAMERATPHHRVHPCALPFSSPLRPPPSARPQGLLPRHAPKASCFGTPPRPPASARPQGLLPRHAPKAPSFGAPP